MIQVLCTICGYYCWEARVIDVGRGHYPKPGCPVDATPSQPRKCCQQCLAKLSQK